MRGASRKSSGSLTRFRAPVFTASGKLHGRLAWNPEASSEVIAGEWVRQTFTNDRTVVLKIVHMMMVSREAVVNYMTPLGLARIMATGHHYGPAPWARTGRLDQSPVYFHKADSLGVGFDRTATGSNQVAQYAPPVRDRYANLATVPDSTLLGSITCRGPIACTRDARCGTR